MTRTKLFPRFLALVLAVVVSLHSAPAQNKEGGGKGRGKDRPDKKDPDSWSAAEYSGLRGEKELQAALASKGFTWITGSPADNEKLSVGKNAQFFGFVALRYQSGRAANRGTLGRAFYAILEEDQRALMARAVLEEQPDLQEWWAVREEILTLLEDHLYTGLPIDRTRLDPLGERFSVLNGLVATREARAFAGLEDSLTAKQRDLITGWRADPERAGKTGSGVRVTGQGIDREHGKQLEDLYAKAFSWLTGDAEDNEIIPIGQPAQFFGFVSIRHKSGHAASRGTIARDFFALLDDEQQENIQRAVGIQVPVVREFLEKRHAFLEQLALLREDPSRFDPERANDLAKAMGRLEMDAACIEAEAYRRIRASLTDDQMVALMKMRGDYVLDEAQVATLDLDERGAALAILCSGCHGAPGQHRVGLPAPTLDGFWDRPIASGPNFDYSDALSGVGRNRGREWTPELLDEFLASPKRFAPGTKMEFQGLLKPEDRQALIEHLKKTR